MARKGDTAKAEVIKKIEDAFGADFITFQDKKIYVKGRENGEELQFAISVTMPKTGVTTTVTVTNPIDVNDFTFGDGNDEPKKPETLANSEEMRKKEEENVKKIMERLGI